MNFSQASQKKWLPLSSNGYSKQRTMENMNCCNVLMDVSGTDKKYSNEIYYLPIENLSFQVEHEKFPLVSHLLKSAATMV